MCGWPRGTTTTGTCATTRKCLWSRLALSDFEGHRDVGLALLRGLPPYELVRVVDFIHGRKATRKVRGGDPSVRRDQARRVIGTLDPSAQEETAAEAAAPGTQVEAFGLFKNVPRSIKTEVTRYLREREADPIGSTRRCSWAARRSSGCMPCCMYGRANRHRDPV